METTQKNSWAAPKLWLRSPFAWLIGGVAILLGGAVYCFLASGCSGPFSAGPDHSPTHAEKDEAVPIPVNTIRPQRKTLVRTLTQPCSIEPWAQAELHAKVSGYLKYMGRELTPVLFAELWGQGGATALAPASSPLASLGPLLGSFHSVLGRASQINIGSVVSAGELLLEVDVPERFQDVVEKESFLALRKAELESARTAIATFEASIHAAKAHKLQAEAEIRKFESELTLHKIQLSRCIQLVKSSTVAPEIADEKQHQVNASQAALENSKAKVLANQAEIAIVTSKLATARVDLRVKEALVRVAGDELLRARLLADYTRICAPFDGIITYRDVDEGDFVQNATTGQTRQLLTITSLAKVKAVLHVPERSASWIHLGGEAAVKLDARTAWQVQGHVSRIGHTLDTQSRTMRVEIDLENADRKLMPGMYGEVNLTLQKIDNAQAIPATAVSSRQGANYITQVSNGRAHRQPVRIRFDDGKELEVVKLLDGREIPLDESEELIISNKGEIGNGQRVNTNLTAH